MNIAIFADVHGRVLLCFKLCARWERETGQRIDLILQAGDLGAFPAESRLDRATIKYAQADPTELGFLTDFVQYDPAVAAMLQQTRCPMIFVRGNHEDHLWLDELEQQSSDTLFPIDAYKRVYCLKSGIPYTFHAGKEAIALLGIGRINAPVDQPGSQQPKYIQEYERRRIMALKTPDIDLLLTHDSPPDRFFVGSGMPEIRRVLDRSAPCYHFFGHYGGPCKREHDANSKTISYKLADLHWSRRSPTLEEGAMGILQWHSREEHHFELVSAAWLKEYTAATWRDL